MKTHLHRRITPSPTYSTWCAIKKRCNNPKASGYFRYGARGIKVHPEWDKSFEAFLRGVGERPSLGHSLDRIDGTKGYVPGNVRWATHREQQSNRSNNTRLTFNGETLIAIEWARKLGMKPNTLYMRLASGWSLERALTEPQAKRRPQKKKL